MDKGITCLQKYGQETCELYIHVVYNVEISVENFKEMMHHTQKGQIPIWLPTKMWTMTKKYQTKYQHEVLPYYNKTGSGQTRRDGYDLGKLGFVDGVCSQPKRH
jgi:hypothetical protein